jgi:hypothetical protein
MNDLIIPPECLAFMLIWAVGFVVLVVLTRNKDKN